VNRGNGVIYAHGGAEVSLRPWRFRASFAAAGVADDFWDPRTDRFG